MVERAARRFRGSVADTRLDLEISDAPLEAIDTLDPPAALVMVSGTDAHEFSGPERQAIRAYVEAGGVILFETAGGRGPFAQAAQQTCRELLGDLAGPPQVLTSSRIVTGEGLPQAPRLARVEYRPYTVDVFGARETRPRLQGMTIGGAPRVLFVSGSARTKRMRSLKKRLRYSSHRKRWSFGLKTPTALTSSHTATYSSPLG